MNSRILLVSPADRGRKLLGILSSEGLDVQTADCVKEAEKQMSGAGVFDVVFADVELPDGSWRDILQFVAATHAAREVVVCSRCGDEQLWAEVIQCGAFDLQQLRRL